MCIHAYFLSLTMVYSSIVGRTLAMAIQRTSTEYYTYDYLCYSCVMVLTITILYKNYLPKSLLNSLQVC